MVVVAERIGVMTMTGVAQIAVVIAAEVAAAVAAAATVAGVVTVVAGMTVTVVVTVTVAVTGVATVTVTSMVTGPGQRSTNVITIAMTVALRAPAPVVIPAVVPAAACHAITANLSRLAQLHLSQQTRLQPLQWTPTLQKWMYYQRPPSCQCPQSNCLEEVTRSMSSHLRKHTLAASPVYALTVTMAAHVNQRQLLAVRPVSNSL